MILVSACLLGEDCKYDGGNNKNESVLKYLDGKKYISVCPEMLGGLKCPRLPSEILCDRVIAKDGKDVTENFASGAKKVLEIALKYNVKEAVLKESSPSCGSNFVYDGSFTKTKIKGMGITAKMLETEGITVKSETDLEK